MCSASRGDRRAIPGDGGVRRDHEPHGRQAFREKSIEGSHAKFTWGVKGGAALAALLPDFRFVEQHSLIEGMAVFAPVYKVLGRISAVRNISNEIIVLERA